MTTLTHPSATRLKPVKPVGIVGYGAYVPRCSLALVGLTDIHFMFSSFCGQI